MSDDSFPFATYSGLLTPDHYQKIGSAIWLFLWCISSTTKEVDKEGIVWGIVLGNKPHKLSELATLFGVNEKTVRRWLEALEKYEYIRITRAPYGLILTVKNSKKYKNRMDKNVQSDDKTERTDMSNHPANMSILSDKNVQTNKDITEDIIKDIKKDVVVNMRPKNENENESKKENDFEPVDYIADYFMVRNGKPGQAPRASDYKEIAAVLTSGVSIEDAIQGIDQAFDEYRPNYPGETISSFAYCKKVILSNFYSQNAREEAKSQALSDKPNVNFRPRSNGRRKNTHEAKLPKWMTEQQTQEQADQGDQDRAQNLAEMFSNL